MPSMRNNFFCFLFKRETFERWSIHSDHMTPRQESHTPKQGSNAGPPYPGAMPEVVEIRRRNKT